MHLIYSLLHLYRVRFLVIILAVTGVFMISCRTKQTESVDRGTITSLPITLSPTVLHVRESTSLPSWLSAVTPPPGEVVSMETFKSFDDSENLRVGIPSRDLGYDSTVCVVIELIFLVQPGDALRNRDEIAKRISMELDGIELIKATRGLSNELLSGIENNLGTPVATYIGPSHTFCWYVDLAAGNHQATILFKIKGTERVQYSWNFEITE